MDQNQLQLFRTFDSIRQEKDGTEFWYARDLQKVLGYSKWENFQNAIKRAKDSIESGSGSIEDHFPDIRKPITGGKGAVQYVDDIELSRYACYLIAINGDTKKPEIAFAQAYFLSKARSYEVLEQKMGEIERLSERERQSYVEKEFGRIAFARGVDGKGLAKIRSVGDTILFGGNNTEQMKSKYGITNPKEPLADFLPAVLINAKGLATGITNINMENKNLRGERQIGTEHMQNNDAVRKLLKERGIIPENLPPEEDIKKVKSRMKKEQKELQQTPGKKLK